MPLFSGIRHCPEGLFPGNGGYRRNFTEVK